MALLFDLPVSTVAVVGGDSRFPVRRIFCVGRNYAAHAREMGMDPVKDPPFFFTKPADAVVDDGASVPYPPQTANLHYEAELVVAIGAAAEDIAPEAVDAVIFGYAAGIDLTRRDLQLKARDMGRPWDWGKAFDHSAPCGPILPAHHLDGVPEAGRIHLSVNGGTRQSADLADMIWGVRDIVSLISQSMALRPGDLIFTGTPEGVGPLVPGDHVVCSVEGIGAVAIDIVPARGGRP
ncbi:fumarylacetoacetate hydrolase family protein [Sphingomonas sp. FW199]|uniref:fumarylacetoacetate hydrolase family protein n=1 Tax=Sphingomonas sp. FW199 TaxID=3400217 RepID=UPI003CF19A88